MIIRKNIGSGEIDGLFHRINDEGNQIVGGNSGFKLKVKWNITQDIGTNITFVNVDVFFAASRGFAITHSNNHRTCILNINNERGDRLDYFSWNNLNANIVRGRENLLVSRTFEIEHDENGRAPGSVWVDDHTNDNGQFVPGYWDDGRLRIDCSFGINIQNLVGLISLAPIDNTGQRLVDNLIRIPNIEHASDAILRMPDEPTGASNTTSTRSWEFPNNIDVIIDSKSPNFHHKVEIQVQNRQGMFAKIKELEYMPGQTTQSSNFTTDENTVIANFLTGFESRQTRFVIRTFTSTGFSIGAFQNERQVGEDVITSVGVVTPPIPIAITANTFEITGPNTQIPIVMDEMDILDLGANVQNVTARMTFQLDNGSGSWSTLQNIIISNTIRENDPLINTVLNNNLINATTNRMNGYIRIITTTQYNGVEFPDPFESNPIEWFYDADNVRPISGTGNFVLSHSNGVISVQVPFNAFQARMSATLERVAASAEEVATQSVQYPTNQTTLVFPGRTPTGGNQLVNITVFDSRGNSFTREASVNVGNFLAPMVVGHAKRLGETSEVEIGCYGNCSEEGHIDTLYRYQIEGEDWVELEPIKCKEKRNGKWVSEKQIINIPTDKNAQFEFMARDSSDCDQEWSRSPSIQVFTTTPTFHIDPSRNIISSGGIPPVGQNNRFFMSMPMYFNGINNRITRQTLASSGGWAGHGSSTDGDPRALVRQRCRNGDTWNPTISMGIENASGNYVSNFTIGTNQENMVVIRQNNTNRHTWTFNTNGNFSAPGNITAANFSGLSSVNPLALGSTTSGTSSWVAREDHRHPMPTAAQVGARPNTWTPTAADVGARANTWMPTAANVGALALSGGELTGTLRARHIVAVNNTIRFGGAGDNATGGRISVTSGHTNIEAPPGGNIRARNTGNVGWISVQASSFIQSSSREFKEGIIKPENIGLNIINDMQVVEYYYKQDPSHPFKSIALRESHLGLIAEDNDDVTTIGHDGVYLDKVIWNNVVALQELDKQNKELLKENDDLKIELNEIKSLLLNISSKLGVK